MTVVAARYLGHSTTPSKPYTPQQAHLQQILALTAASLSLLLGIFTLYCFWRMKRDFRHHLIILLVAANMIKSLGFLIFPILELATASAYGGGPKPISRPLCIANGFNLSWGIEATDFMILLIAVHTALTVFRPRTTTEQTGLYPFRIIAYLLLLAFPTLMASLAFVDTSFPYTSSGTFCYLPWRPIWYRLALSWVPRYLILLTIVIVYGAVYVYAKYKFDEFKNKVSEDDGSLLTTQEGMASLRISAEEPMSQSTRTSEPPTKAPNSGVPPIGQSSNARVLQRHEVIKRQLRLMFIYPVVYFLISVPPFMNHCWLYTEDHTPPFAVTTIAVVCLAGQCAVDCIVFMTREKPWRFVGKQINLPRRGNGFNRDRMPIGGMELAPVRTRAQLNGGAGRAGAPREWWDQEAYKVDGAAGEGSRASNRSQ